MLIRQIFKSTEAAITFQIPPEMVGKTLELLVFEIDETELPPTVEERLARVQEITKNSQVDLSGFKFDRDEANNYDE